MARNLSDVFSSDDNDQNTSSDTNTNQNADVNADASNDGINISNESYRRDEDGEVSYDRTEADTGNTDLGGNLDIDNMVDNITNTSSSSSNSEFLDSDLHQIMGGSVDWSARYP